jgi:beta-phosphoglucomutase family hydrolase
MMEGAIFDMDGVLLDNVDYHVEAFRILGEEVGVRLTRGDVNAVMGQKNPDMLKALLRRPLSDQDVRRFSARKEELYRELVAPRLQASRLRGLTSFLDILRSAGRQIGLATSGPVENVDFVLDRLAIRRYFAAAVHGDEVAHGKPEPDCFLLAAERLGLSPLRCTVFEDTVSGIKAALRAGCKCVALSTTHRLPELEQAGPDLIVDDFEGLDLGQLDALWRPRGIP